MRKHMGHSYEMHGCSTNPNEHLHDHSFFAVVIMPEYMNYHAIKSFFTIEFVRFADEGKSHDKTYGNCI